jgi:hypothetical protein
VRLCQSIDYGQILDLQVRDREPQFNPAPTVLLDIKLDAARVGRPDPNFRISPCARRSVVCWTGLTNCRPAKFKE